MKIIFRIFLLTILLTKILSHAHAHVQAASNTVPKKVINPFGPREVPILIVMGQSNAEGFLQWLPDASRAGVPLRNVYGLSRSGSGNLSASSNHVTWTNYSVTNFNLGDGYESIGGRGYGTYNMAGEFAQLWQNYLNAYPGELPNLHVIHIAYNGNGFMPENSPRNAWDPAANNLYQLAMNVIPLAMKNLIANGSIPRVIGLHWNQWEAQAEAKSFSTARAAENGFRNYLANYRGLFGGRTPPTYLYRPRAQGYDPAALQSIIDAFYSMSSQSAVEKYYLMDAGLSPYFNGADKGNFGIFSDGVHYKPEVQQWFARQQWNNLFARKILGAPVAYPFVKGDFDGDGKSDFLFKLLGNNQYAVWHLNGLTFKSSSNFIPSPAAGWVVVQSADFDGDGKADLLIKQEGTNSYAINYMNGLTAIKPNSGPITRPAPGWTVAQVADFDGDGKADLLFKFENSNRYVIWYMNGLTYKSTSGFVTDPAPGWHVVQAADFDGDGKADLLFNLMGTNQYAVWHLNGLTFKPTSNFITQPSPGWYVMQAADFDGDGKADLLFNYSGSNGYVIWFMNGSTYKFTSDFVTQAAPGWNVVHVADFDGDGRSDLLFSKTGTNQYVIWHMSGTVYKATSGFLTQPAPGWSIWP
jgi:hypothetical protein